MVNVVIRNKLSVNSRLGHYDYKCKEVCIHLCNFKVDEFDVFVEKFSGVVAHEVIHKCIDGEVKRERDAGGIWKVGEEGAVAMLLKERR